MFKLRNWECRATACLTGLVLTSFLAAASAQDEPTPAPPTVKPNSSADLPQTPPSAKPDPPSTSGSPDAEKPQPPSATNPQPPGKVTAPRLAPSLLRPLDSPLSPFANLQMPPGQRPYLARLSRAPDLFGDFNTLSVTDIQQVRHNNDPLFPTVGVPSGGSVGVPSGGSARRYKNEQARALPTDRAFVFFNHFHNAMTIRGPGGNVNGDINQFTFGVERTFADGDWSAEVRLPISAETDITKGMTSAHSNGVGNLVVTLKNLLYVDSDYALAMGLAVTAPTGSDADIGFFGSQITIQNEAVHLLPYLALQATPSEDWFFHVFAQVDVAANGDGIEVFDSVAMTTSTGRIVEQTLLFLDVSAGYWWMKDDDPESTLTGVASVLELHYTGALNDAHIANVGSIAVGNLDNRIDVLNMTIGLHTEWQKDTAIRFATVVPLRSGTANRFFDVEFQLALVKRL